MFLMTATVLLSHCENLLYFQPLESLPGCFKVLANALPQRMGVGVSILLGAVLGAASGVCLH